MMMMMTGTGCDCEGFAIFENGVLKKMIVTDSDNGNNCLCCGIISA